MKHTIEIASDDLNKIIVEDLKDAYTWNLDNDGNEAELKRAIEVVLKYYMSPSEYNEWIRKKRTVLDSSYPDGDGYWKEQE